MEDEDIGIDGSEDGCYLISAIVNLFVLAIYVVGFAVFLKLVMLVYRML